VTGKNFIIIDVTKMACEGIDSLQLAQKRAQLGGSCEHGNEHSDIYKIGGIY